ncbi:hypothetical protein SD77_1864 [Bacillus badius]|uniref:Ribose 5-phosphate isomerase B n=1 Tax=Bacillus badius TaxID=1455 RepID=A0ABR5AQF8_BACBA|nr:hypothetical protein SD78_0927 [Bacillus badius]KIL76904.1 hypothetical protein SD77_1864 [Bacillus badius]
MLYRFHIAIFHLSSSFPSIMKKLFQKLAATSLLKTAFVPIE